MEADALFTWFLRIATTNKPPPTEVGKLREQVELAIKNKKHCDRLTSLEIYLKKDLRSMTELSTIDNDFDIRFCARTRFALSTGIYRSWFSFVDHLSRRLEEIGIPYVANERTRECIAELLWEGTAHKTNGWTHKHNNVNIEAKIASRIDQLVSLPIVQSTMEELASLQGHLTLVISALISYETRCSSTRIVDAEGNRIEHPQRASHAGKPLRIGDFITLRNIPTGKATKRGFLGAEGVLDDNCVVAEQPIDARRVVAVDELVDLRHAQHVRLERVGPFEVGDEVADGRRLDVLAVVPGEDVAGRRAGLEREPRRARDLVARREPPELRGVEVVGEELEDARGPADLEDHGRVVAAARRPGQR